MEEGAGSPVRVVRVDLIACGLEPISNQVGSQYKELSYHREWLFSRWNWSRLF